MRISRATHAPRRVLSPALALALAGAAVALFAWPLVREPTLRLVPAFAHVLAAWAAVVAALGWMSRRLGPDDAGGDADG